MIELPNGKKINREFILPHEMVYFLNEAITNINVVLDSLADLVLDGEWEWRNEDGTYDDECFPAPSHLMNKLESSLSKIKEVKICLDEICGDDDDFLESDDDKTRIS